ncbi:MAG: hypothetical protein EXR99_13530 [Gemmataceae bacterium]|nr:hypothetical protein [Gemmataceae bacterium]
MTRQRLKQENADSSLRLAKDDFLIAGETPRFDGKVLRLVRMRVARDGFAERSVHDIGFGPSSFSHNWTCLPLGKLAEITLALECAQAVQGSQLGLAGKEDDEDPNGHFRVIECWVGDRRARLSMQYVKGLAQKAVPAFEAAWLLVVSQFPKLQDPGRTRGRA